MKVLSVQQPWAGLIFHGKPVENRTWASGYRGELLIHAGKKLDKGSLEYFATAEGRELMRRNSLPEICDWRGGIIGIVNMTGCQHYDDVDPSARSRYQEPDQFGFMLENARQFNGPILCKGKLGFFVVPSEVSTLSLKNAIEESQRR